MTAWATSRRRRTSSRLKAIVRARTRAWLGGRLQRRVRGGRGFELPGELARPRQLAAAQPRQQRAQAERQGEAADRGLALAVGEALAAVFEAPDRAGRFFAADRRRARVPGRSARRRPRRVRSPAASSPLPSAPSAIPPRSCVTARAARRSPGPSRSSSPTPGRWADTVASWRLFGPSAPAEGLAEAAERARSALAIGPGPITARTPGSAAMRRCQRASSARSPLRRDRPVFGRGDEDEGRLPAGADGARRSSRRSWRAWLELGSSSMPGAPVVKASVGSASSTSGTATRQAARAGLRSAAVAAAATVRRSAVRYPRIRGSEPRNRADRRRPADPAGVDPLAEQRQQRRHREGRDGDADHGDDPHRRRQRQQQRARLQEGRADDRDDQGRAGKERGAAGAGPGHRGGRPRARARPRAPRGSGRRSAASSRPPAPAPSSCRRRARARRSSSPS